MQYLYIITNNINGKQYVGKTCKSILSRWKDHKSASKREINKPLYAAMNQYGVHNFSIELLGEFSDEDIYDAEVSAIKKYNTYLKGYNATLGGEGLKLIDIPDKVICQKYYELGSAAKCAADLNISASTVLNVLSKYDLTKIGNTKPRPTKKVLIVDLNKKFESCKDCAQFLLDTNIVSNVSLTSIIASIQAVCTGNRSKYKKLVFKYLND